MAERGLNYLLKLQGLLEGLCVTVAHAVSKWGALVTRVKLDDSDDGDKSEGNNGSVETGGGDGSDMAAMLMPVRYKRTGNSNER